MVINIKMKIKLGDCKRIRGCSRGGFFRLCDRGLFFWGGDIWGEIWMIIRNLLIWGIGILEKGNSEFKVFSVVMDLVCLNKRERVRAVVE